MMDNVRKWISQARVQHHVGAPGRGLGSTCAPRAAVCALSAQHAAVYAYATQHAGVYAYAAQDAGLIGDVLSTTRS